MRDQGLLSVVSLFCGPGGLDQGFRDAGFRTALALDSNPAAVATFNLNHPGHVARESDLSSLTGETFVELVRSMSRGVLPRGVIGGPPCQSFSNANVRQKPRDPRSRLGLAFARLVTALNHDAGVDFFAFENVVGMRAAKHGHRFAVLRRELRKAGFNLFVGELDAGQFGVPQHRRRLIVVGINRAHFPWARFHFPSGGGRMPTVRDTIGGLPPPLIFHRGLKPGDVPFHPNHWTMRPKSPKFRTEIRTNGRSFKLLAWDSPSRTVAYGNREVHIHPSGERRLSVLEAMLLQGFPQGYVLSGTLSDQISQVSDAVPPGLGEAVARAIVEAIYKPLHTLRSQLLAWHKQHQRPFPWRQTTDAMAILVTEKLLQQTAATEGVVRAYRLITGRYRSWRALARAETRSLERIVEPLGFRYRARELVELARVVDTRYGGDLPAELAELQRLPGVGDYCARAVLSFAFGKPVAVVDTNVARFLVRYFGLTIHISKNPARDRRLHHIADAIIQHNGSRELNLAILDLCAAHCTARSPTCHGCPLAGHCCFGAKQYSDAVA
jgi:DNA (cytosine-5)-methyltransferase 1